MADETITYPLRVAHCPLVTVLRTNKRARAHTYTHKWPRSRRIFFFSQFVLSTAATYLLFTDQLFKEIDALFCCVDFFFLYPLII